MWKNSPIHDINVLMEVVLSEKGLKNVQGFADFWNYDRRCDTLMERDIEEMQTYFYASLRVINAKLMFALIRKNVYLTCLY